MARLGGSLVLATGVAGISGLGALLGMLWGFGLKCDDSCGTPPPWRENPSAWQWDALGIVGIAGFVCALGLLAAVALRRRPIALAALVSWALLAGAFIRLFRESGLTSHAERGWAGLPAVVIAGLGAIALTPPREKPAPPAQ
jgi:hypothetical protein